MPLVRTPLTVLALAACLISCQSSTAPEQEPDGPAGDATHPVGDVVSVLALTGRPHGVAVASNGTFVISRIDDASVMFGAVTETGQTFTTPVRVGMTPAHVALNRTGSTAYTANQSGQSVSFVQKGATTATATIPLTDEGFNLLVSPDGAWVYVTTAGGTLHVIDAAQRRSIATVNVGNAANGLALHEPSGTLYVSAIGAATITAIRTSSNAAMRTYQVSGSPQRIAVSADGAVLYVASEAVGLELVQTATGSRLIVPGVLPGAVGLALSPDETQVYVTNPPAGLIQVVDLATRRVVRSIEVASRPRNVAFASRGRIAIVTDEAGQVVFIR